MEKFLQTLLSKVAENLNWKNWKTEDINYENGNGFLGEFFLISIINEDSGEKLDLAVKKAFTIESRRQELGIGQAFKNELIFYNQIVPTLLKFKDSKKIQEQFQFFTKFYISCEDDGQECLVMENLKSCGYYTIKKEDLLGPDYVKFVFETYGKFHALSFALKDQNPEEYNRIKSGIKDFVVFLFNDNFQKSIKLCCVQAFECVDNSLQENCKDYIQNSRKIFMKTSNYKGEYSCIVHGDCWTNNIMFQKQDSKLTNMKLIDFQVTRESTPVHDLSYFLYAGASKEVYQNIDQYLKIYHQSFSKICQDLGSDPDKVYPFEALIEDWRKYSKWGLLWGLMFNKVKLVEEQSGMVGEDFYENFDNMKIGENKLNLYRERMRDLIEDVYKKGYLIN